MKQWQWIVCAILGAIVLLALAVCIIDAGVDGQHISVIEAGYTAFQYDNGDDYVSDGCYRIVDKDGKIGYAAENGEVIISPRFAFGFPFEDGRAKVTDSGHIEEVDGSNGEYHYWASDNWFWIDKMGNRLEIEELIDDYEE